MREFKPGDRVIDEYGKRGIIVEKSKYTSRISETSQCLRYDGADYFMVKPNEKLRLDIQWLREERLKDFLD
ncbi:MAG: hypothetical protein SLAVMIC_00738 [uncultured marine phage]|uniref:Uncharacterized protein n=1 Tax=uncultured marine phage TaxID=707152 RepID=A0A8D9C9F5_9VIRU|nr:MAG: hypothetical protein SLAVMIC_00738 [uncultured marine phage]